MSTSVFQRSQNLQHRGEQTSLFAQSESRESQGAARENFERGSVRVGRRWDAATREGGSAVPRRHVEDVLEAVGLFTRRRGAFRAYRIPGDQLVGHQRLLRVLSD